MSYRTGGAERDKGRERAEESGIIYHRISLALLDKDRDTQNALGQYKTSISDPVRNHSISSPPHYPNRATLQIPHLRSRLTCGARPHWSSAHHIGHGRASPSTHVPRLEFQACPARLSQSESLPIQHRIHGSTRPSVTSLTCFMTRPTNRATAADSPDRSAPHPFRAVPHNAYVCLGALSTTIPTSESHCNIIHIHLAALFHNVPCTPH